MYQMEKANMKVLELYSGIGGMHLALEESGILSEIVASVEVNNTANIIYKHNFPATNILNLNIEGLTASRINKLGVDTILMSPPCQPFTRNGLQNDIKDPRTASFLHVLDLLPHIQIKRILIENVKGFEMSEMRNILIKTLNDNGYFYQEFILSPTQLNVPNTRTRYYCLARKKPDDFPFETRELMEQLPVDTGPFEHFDLSQIIEENVSEKYFLSEQNLCKRFQVLDVICKDSKRSCCFTKAYGRFFEGTGSVLCNKTESELKKVYSDLKDARKDSQEYLDIVKSLNLRFLTPKEISRLMCFKESYSFPNTITDRQKYMVLGNSINVKVVAELIKLLI